MSPVVKQIECHNDRLTGACSYLNMNGCEEEGLYRVPGSGKDVKYWQMRFDKGMCFFFPGVGGL
jgi:hypothetical protein